MAHHKQQLKKEELAQSQAEILSRVLTEEDVSKVVNKGFLMNAAAIGNWQSTCDSLGLPPASKKQWTIQFNTEQINYEELFKRMISEWIRKQGQFATLDSLCRILRGEGDNGTPDHLIGAFGDDNR